MSTTRVSLCRSTLYTGHISRQFSPQRERSLNVKIRNGRVTHASLNLEVESPKSLEKSASPSSKEVMEGAAEFLVGTYARAPLVLYSGKGCKLYDLEGQEYLDMTSGIAVNALGHSDPDLVKAMKDQADTLIHVSNVYHSVPQVVVISFLVFTLPFVVNMSLVSLMSGEDIDQ